MLKLRKSIWCSAELWGWQLPELAEEGREKKTKKGPEIRIGRTEF